MEGWIQSLLLEKFLEAGFILKDDTIKLQHKMMTTRQRGKSYDFYLIGHEHLYMFRKAADEEKTARMKTSMRS